MLNIKFRVWDRTVKVMTKVSQINFHSDYTYPQVVYRYKDPRTGKVIDERANFGWNDGCDIVSVMQYTGLKDSNGKEIYEGDVVKVGIFTYQVIFSDGCFDVIGIQNDKRDYLKCIVVNHVGIVIGNIYENPDLLKEDKYNG